MRNPEGPSISDPIKHDLYLDWLRGIAALLVFLGHVRGAFFVQWSDLDVSSKTHINFLLFFLTRFGREAVITFFVLSGYLVGGHALAQYRDGRFSLRGYLVARVSRMYVVVVPALLLTCLLDFLDGAWVGTRNGIYPFFANLFFLQGIVAEPYGSNGALWSLSYEWWFYLLFGCGVAAMASSSFHRSAAGLAVIATTLMLWLRCPAMLIAFPLWLLGVAVRFIPPVRLPRRASVLIALVSMMASCVLASALSDWKGDLMVALATTAFIYLTNHEPLKGRWFAGGGPFAAPSFSLYAVHYPLNIFLLGILVPNRLTHAGIRNWGEWILIVIAEASICYLFYRMFERHTPVVRTWLLQLLTSSRPENTQPARDVLPIAKASPPTTP